MSITNLYVRTFICYNCDNDLGTYICRQWHQIDAKELALRMYAYVVQFKNIGIMTKIHSGSHEIGIQQSLYSFRRAFCLPNFPKSHYLSGKYLHSFKMKWVLGQEGTYFEKNAMYFN